MPDRQSVAPSESEGVDGNDRRWQEAYPGSERGIDRRPDTEPQDSERMVEEKRCHPYDGQQHQLQPTAGHATIAHADDLPIPLTRCHRTRDTGHPSRNVAF